MSEHRLFVADGRLFEIDRPCPITDEALRRGISPEIRDDLQKPYRTILPRPVRRNRVTRRGGVKGGRSAAIAEGDQAP
jgi:hypothetical protein